MYKVSSNNVVYSMSPDNKPVLKVEPGSELLFETQDCFSNQIQSEDLLFESTDWNTVNPATGPVEIKGAKKGDVLKVEIKSIDLADHGVMITEPEMGALNKFINESETKIIPIEDNMVVFNEKIKLPVQAMIGVIGTSPEKEDISCGTPDAHGGNMDNKVIAEGSTLYLPVWVDGGMLAMGDLHAYMGDGEVVICGVEIAGKVKVKVDLLSAKNIPNPMVETIDAWYTIASAETLDEAAQMATDDMFRFITERTSLSSNETAMLMSLICDLEVCQIVDPQKTARMKLDKKALAKYDIVF